MLACILSWIIKWLSVCLFLSPTQKLCIWLWTTYKPMCWSPTKSTSPNVSTCMTLSAEQQWIFPKFLDATEIYHKQSLSPRNSVGGDIVIRSFVGGWVSEWLGSWVGGCLCGSVPFYLVDTIATSVFAQSLSNFTCTFTMMRGGSLLILGHGVIDQGQLCPPARGCHALRCLVYSIALHHQCLAKRLIGITFSIW